MPQADPELQRKWGGEDGIGEDKAVTYLLSKGWTHSRSMWTCPHHETATDDEMEALTFLMFEWDHGYATASQLTDQER